MTPQELKNSILQLAVQGKLVPQRPEEGSAEELLAAIRAQKQSSDSRSTVKKKKSSHKDTETQCDVPADEIPFEIPASWKWVRIGDYCPNMFSGKSPKYTKIETPYKIIGQAANQPTGLDYRQIKFTTREFWESMDEEYFLRKNDVLLNTLGNGTLGRSGLVLSLPQNLLTDGHLFVFRFGNETASKFFYYFLQGKKSEIEKSANGSTNQTFLSLSKVRQWLIPLPPLAEQKRIVAKIEELLPLCERYGNTYNELQVLNKRVPGDLQKSLLQLAVQGKLVPQRPEEGSAEELLAAIRAEKQKLLKAGKIKKEKLLPEISDDEIPFDIPENWCFTHIGELFLHNTGKAQNALGSPNGVVRKFITTSNLYWNRFDFSKVKKMPFTEQELKRCTVCKGDLLICEGGDYGRAAVWNFDEEVCIQNHVHRLRPYKEICINYFYYIFYLYKNTGRLKGRGVGIQGLSNDALHKILIPLPPLAEQKRIVAKLEELLPLCDRLSLLQG
ncbi:MAG: restriction endonuclease subunit S [Opitutales bacterium]|nr:restriction endonuclease subunit S [Opitutales bacterium]